MDLSRYLWDTRHSGNARARLTPWLYPEHHEAVKVGIAMTRATNPALADEIEKAYTENEAAATMPAVPVTITAAVEVPKEEPVEPEEKEAPKKRGRKPKNAV